ncbi:MAG: hypothetical protein M3540_07290 [Actinomycetota bacterium]|nr:hypothetical protein [Actinomycetota bacterium]
MPEKETAYELKPDSGLTSTDGVHYGGVPGVYRLGEPVAVVDTGRTTAELAEIVKEQGVPLEETTVRAKPSVPDLPRTHEELDAVAEMRGVVFGPDVKTVADKQAALEGVAPVPDEDKG